MVNNPQTKIIMKQKYFLSALLSAGFLLTACQSDPEVGSSLYPTEPEDFSPKAYIANVDVGVQELAGESYVEQGQGQATITVPEDTVVLKVKLSGPAPKDLTFMVKSDNTKLEKNAEAFTKLGDDALTYAVNKVVIKQGATESDEFFKITLNKDAKSLFDLTGTGKVAFTIESLDDVKIAKMYNTYIWDVTKVFTNINSKGTIDGLTQVPTTDYTVSNSYNSSYSMESSGVFSGGTLMYTSFGTLKNKTIHIALTNPIAISGLGLLSAYSYWGSDISQNALNNVEIFAGMTADNLTKVGDAYRENPPTSENDFWNIAFYEPVTAKYIDIVAHDTFLGTGVYAYTSGLKLYKK